LSSLFLASLVKNAVADRSKKRAQEVSKNVFLKRPHNMEGENTKIKTCRALRALAKPINYFARYYGVAHGCDLCGFFFKNNFSLKNDLFL